jgi:hypothetical protein
MGSPEAPGPSLRECGAFAWEKGGSLVGSRPDTVGPGGKPGGMRDDSRSPDGGGGAGGLAAHGVLPSRRVASGRAVLELRAACHRRSSTRGGRIQSIPGPGPVPRGRDRRARCDRAGRVLGPRRNPGLHTGQQPNLSISTGSDVGGKRGPSRAPLPSRTAPRGAQWRPGPSALCVAGSGVDRCAGGVRPLRGRNTERRRTGRAPRHPPDDAHCPATRRRQPPDTR